jgi:hypothetical protein
VATSGSVDFSETAREIITDALEDIGVCAIGAEPEAEDAEKARTKLGQMLKTWGTQERLWIKTEGSVTLVAATASYASSPVSLARRVLGVRQRTSGNDVELRELSYSEYQALPNKTQTGTPTAYMFDPQRSTRTLYVWPVPDTTIAAATTLKVSYLRVIEDVDSLDDDLDIPQEWLEAASASLAARLAIPYRVHLTDPVGAQAITQRATTLYAQLTADSDEDASVFIQPA